MNRNQTKLMICSLVFLSSFGFAAQAVTDLAYAFAANNIAQTILPTHCVTFNLTSFPNDGINPPFVGGSAFEVLADGDYLIMFHVRGAPASPVPTLQPIVFDLLANDVFIPGSRFQSDVQTTSLPAVVGSEAVNGQVIVSLTAGTTIKLRNFTKFNNSSNGDSVFLNASIGAHNVNNASLTIVRLTTIPIIIPE